MYVGRFTNVPTPTGRHLPQRKHVVRNHPRSTRFESPGPCASLYFYVKLRLSLQKREICTQQYLRNPLPSDRGIGPDLENGEASVDCVRTKYNKGRFFIRIFCGWSVLLGFYNRIRIIIF